MKKLLLLLLLFCSTMGFSQISLNMNLLGSFDVDTLPTHSFGTFNDVWAYVDGAGNEYAVMGSAKYIHFFDVTDPSNIVEILAHEVDAQTTWRDFKVYGDRVYAASDNSGEGLIIFDVSTLPAPPVVTYDSTEFFNSTHNIFIDEENGRLYAAGADTQNDGLIVLDIATNPDQPLLLGSVSLVNGLLGGYVHDVYVRDNIAYCSHGNTSSFVIWDFNDAANPGYIASFESNGYNHSSWLTDDGNTVIFAEEVPTGLPLGLLDISNMMNDELTLYQYFKFPLLAPDHEGATPHNPFILGDLAFISYYEDGLQVIDISDPSAPFTTAYYDTYPENNDYNGYVGCWGVYPYLPSGNILASDMQNGLFILEMDLTPTSTTDGLEQVNAFKVFPNPTNGLLNIQLETSQAEEVEFVVSTLTGQTLISQTRLVNGSENIDLNIDELPAGIYILTANLESAQLTEKIIKQ